MKKKVNSLLEAIADYESIVGDKISYSAEDKVYTHVLPNYHFMIWAILEEAGERFFWIGEIYGDFKEFCGYIDEVMERNDLNTIITATPRDGRAHMRKWKMERLPERDFISKNGIKYRVLKGERKNLARSYLW